jgi:hypothetical protein
VLAKSLEREEVVLTVQVLLHNRKIDFDATGKMKLLAACEEILLTQKSREAQADASVYWR